MKTPINTNNPRVIEIHIAVYKERFTSSNTKKELHYGVCVYFESYKKGIKQDTHISKYTITSTSIRIPYLNGILTALEASSKLENAQIIIKCTDPYTIKILNASEKWIEFYKTVIDINTLELFNKILLVKKSISIILTAGKIDIYPTVNGKETALSIAKNELLLYMKNQIINQNPNLIIKRNSIKLRQKIVIDKTSKRFIEILVFGERLFRFSQGAWCSIINTYEFGELKNSKTIYDESSNTSEREMTFKAIIKSLEYISGEEDAKILLYTNSTNAILNFVNSHEYNTSSSHVLTEKFDELKKPFNDISIIHTKFADVIDDKNPKYICSKILYETEKKLFEKKEKKGESYPFEMTKCRYNHESDFYKTSTQKMSLLNTKNLIINEPIVIDKSLDKLIEIYTDGACKNTTSKCGGWCALIKGYHKGELVKIDVIKDFSLETTNNRMEFTALIKALEKIKSCKDIRIMIRADSTYTMYGFSNCELWLCKKKTKNKDLVKSMAELKKGFTNISIHHVSAHIGIEGNEYVDKIAEEQCELAHQMKLGNRKEII